MLVDVATRFDTFASTFLAAASMRLASGVAAKSVVVIMTSRRTGSRRRMGVIVGRTLTARDTSTLPRDWDTLYLYEDAGERIAPLFARFSRHLDCSTTAQSGSGGVFMTLHRRTLLLVVLSALVAFPSFGQHQIPAGGETIDVSIVNLDVFVTDRRGNRVHGLKADDFEVRENGEVQPITNFTEYAAEQSQVRARTAAAPPAAVNGVDVAPPTKRTMVIFVQIVRQPSTGHQVFASLRQFVRQSVRPGDAVAVVAFRDEATMLQSYTDDRRALDAALVLAEQASLGVAGSDSVAMLRRAEADDEAAAQAAARMRTQVRGQILSTSQLELAEQQFRELVVTRRITKAVTSVLNSMSSSDGKKLMILSLYGYGLSKVKSGGGAVMFEMTAQIEAERRAVMRTANANNVTLYPITPIGMPWPNGVSALETSENIFNTNSDRQIVRNATHNTRLLNETTSLGEIADQTGGLMAAGPAQIANLLPRITDDLETYYSMAYRVSSSGSARRRDVVVVAKNKNYRVRSRRSVVGKTDDVQMQDRVVANLYEPVGAVIPLRVQLGAATKKGGDVWSIPLVVRIPVASLTTREQGDAIAGSFSIFVATGGEFAVLNRVQQRTQPFTIKRSDLAKSADGHLTFNSTVELDHFSNQMSVGVRDDVSKEYGLVRVELPPLVSEENGQ